MAATADVQKYMKIDNHIEYFIKVFYNGKQWCIYKRYSDFVKLNEYLKRDGIIINHPLPSKSWLNRFDTSLLNSRQKELQSYINILLKHTSSTDTSLIKEFLEVDSKLLDIAKTQTRLELQASERIRTIVEVTKIDMIQIMKIDDSVDSRNKSTSTESLTTSPKSKKLNRMNSFQGNTSFNNSKLFNRSTSLSVWSNLSISPRDANNRDNSRKDKDRYSKDTATNSSENNNNSHSNGQSSSARFLLEAHSASMESINQKISLFLSNSELIYQQQKEYIDNLLSELSTSTLHNDNSNGYNINSVTHDNSSMYKNGISNIETNGSKSVGSNFVDSQNISSKHGIMKNGSIENGHKISSIDNDNDSNITDNSRRFDTNQVSLQEFNLFLKRQCKDLIQDLKVPKNLKFVSINEFRSTRNNPKMIVSKKHDSNDDEVESRPKRELLLRPTPNH